MIKEYEDAVISKIVVIPNEDILETSPFENDADMDVGYLFPENEKKDYADHGMQYPRE